MRIAIALTSAVMALAACSEPRDPGAPSNEHEWTKQARADNPTALALHTNVIQRSCAPAGGVCHNNKEFPDLHTVGNFVSTLNKPCNSDETDPLSIFDGCEPPGDQLRVGAFTATISSIGPEEYDDLTGEAWMPFTLMVPSPMSTSAMAGDVLRGGQAFLSVPANIQLTAGSNAGRITDIYYLEYQLYYQLYEIVGGDPNENGIAGAELGWAQVARGKPEASYLAARVAGLVPGSRMPLANQALSNAEYVALFCWIETLRSNPKAEDGINYSACNYAKDPIDYELPES